MRTIVDIDALNRLAKHMTNRYSEINCGGCAVVSYLVHEKLLGVTKNLRTIFLGCRGNGDITIEELVKQNSKITLRDLNDNGYYCNHAIIVFEVDGVEYAFDTDEGAIPFDEYKKTHWSGTFYEIPLEVNRQVAEAKDNWNDDFDRSQIPRMKLSIKNSRLVKEVE